MALAAAAGLLFRRGRDGGGLRPALALASRVSGSRASTSSATLPLADAEEAPGASKKVPKVAHKGAAPEYLLGMGEAELTALATGRLKQPKFRGRQLHDALYAMRKTSIADLTQLPATLRDELAAAGLKVGRAGGVLRTSTRPTLNLILLQASKLKVSHAPMSVECLFSVTLPAGGAAGGGGVSGRHQEGAAAAVVRQRHRGRGAGRTLLAICRKMPLNSRNEGSKCVG